MTNQPNEQHLPITPEGQAYLDAIKSASVKREGSEQPAEGVGRVSVEEVSAIWDKTTEHGAPAVCKIVNRFVERERAARVAAEKERDFANRGKQTYAELYAKRSEYCGQLQNRVAELEPRVAELEEQLASPQPSDAELPTAHTRTIDGEPELFVGNVMLDKCVQNPIVWAERLNHALAAWRKERGDE